MSVYKGKTLFNKTIIAAVRNNNDLKYVLKSDIEIIFVLYGSISSIISICSVLREHGKIPLVHLDLIDGLKPDKKGIEFINKYAKPFGIITTKQGHIKLAKEASLYTIQRIFVVDSLSLESAKKNINSSMPDAVEVMPGIAWKVIESLKESVNLPIIAGGLISSRNEIEETLRMGATAISTSEKSLWGL